MEPRGFGDSENILYDTVMGHMCHYTCVKGNPNIKYELWMMMTCRLSCNKLTALVQDVDSGRGCACVGAESIRGLSILPAQFCREPKTALKNKFIAK